jgi:hypothetical protein
MEIHFEFKRSDSGSKPIAMKRAVIILAVVFALGILMSACNKHICPAYSQIDTEQTLPNG